MPMTARRTHRLVCWLALTLLAVFGLLACGGAAPTGGGGGSPAAPPGGGSSASTTIVIKDFDFAPADLMVAPGATIRIENQDQATHTVTAADRPFDSGNIAAGQTGEITAPGTPGSYPYSCTLHPFMTATLTVR